MGPIEQKFEVERPIAAIYEAISRPLEVLESLPIVTGVHQVTEDVYRITVGRPEQSQEVELQLTSRLDLRRVEWRTSDGAWSGAIQLEAVGPGRTAVGVHAEAAPGTQGESVPATVVHDTVHALKRALQLPQVRISHAATGATDERYFGSTARRYASEWRTGRSAFMRPTEFPFALMRTISREMDRLWDQVWHGTPIARLPQLIPGLPWNPDVEVCEQDDQVRVRIDVPGVDASHVNVEIAEGTLTVRGERQDERGDEDGQRRSELHYGSFTRRIPLPDGVDSDAASAVLRNGVLEIRIPLHRREPRRVPVLPLGS